MKIAGSINIEIENIENQTSRYSDLKKGDIESLRFMQLTSDGFQILGPKKLGAKGHSLLVHFRITTIKAKKENVRTPQIKTDIKGTQKDEVSEQTIFDLAIQDVSQDDWQMVQDLVSEQQKQVSDVFEAMKGHG